MMVQNSQNIFSRKSLREKKNEARHFMKRAPVLTGKREATRREQDDSREYNRIYPIYKPIRFE